MTESKAMKQREYFTRVTYHDHTKPTNLAGEPLIERRSSHSPDQIIVRKTSPIRMNDTYRTTLVLGEDEDPCKTLNHSFTAHTLILDKQFVQKQQYLTQTKSRQHSFSSLRLHKSQQPASHKLLSCEQTSNITKINRVQYEQCKAKCGMVGSGMKGVMDQVANERLVNNNTQIQETICEDKQKMRNLDGEMPSIMKRST